MTSITVLLIGSDYTIHRPNCADIARDARKADDAPWTFEADTLEEVMDTLWGDQASDDYERGTDEWRNLLMSVYLPHYTHVKPCIKLESIGKES